MRTCRRSLASVSSSTTRNDARPRCAGRNVGVYRTVLQAGKSRHPYTHSETRIAFSNNSLVTLLARNKRMPYWATKNAARSFVRRSVRRRFRRLSDRHDSRKVQTGVFSPTNCVSACKDAHSRDAEVERKDRACCQVNLASGLPWTCMMGGDNDIIRPSHARERVSRPPNQDQNARVTPVDIGAQSPCGQCIVCCACSAIAGDSGRNLCSDVGIPINIVKRSAFFATLLGGLMQPTGRCRDVTKMQSVVSDSRHLTSYPGWIW